MTGPVCDRSPLRRRVRIAVPALLAATLATVWLPGPAMAATATCPPAGGVSVPAAPTPAGADLAVRGHGWGHSLGLSQYGAQGGARLGCTASQILGTYYPGTHVSSATLGSTVMLRLLTNQPKGHSDVTAQAGQLTWLAGTKAVVQPTGTTWHVRLDATTHGADLDNGTTVLLKAAAGAQLRANEGSPGNVARVRSFGGATGTSLQTDLQLKWDYTRFVGTTAGLTTTQVIVPSGGVSGVDKYLWGIAEVPVSWPAEALKTQAIAARTYLVHGYWNAAEHAYLIGTTTASQNYGGYAKEAADAAYASPAPWHTAVLATATKIVEDSGGHVIDSLYTSSHGGRSEDVRYVWGSTGFPYLVSVDDSRWDLASDNPNRSWTVGFTRAQVAARFGLDTISSITVGAPGTASRLSGVHVTGTRKGAAVGLTYDGWDARNILGLLSPGMTFQWVKPADTVAPVAHALAGPNGFFHWSATDAAPSSGIAGYDVTITHGSTTDWQTTTPTTATSHAIVGTPGTTYTLTVKAHDRAGNVSPDATATTTVPMPGTYHPVEPFRLLDTRTTTPAPTPMTNNQVRVIRVGGVGTVPGGVSAVAVNVTATQSTGSGYLTAGNGTTGTSNLVVAKGRTTAELMVLPVDDAGNAELYASVAGSVHVVVDVEGYVTPDTSGSGYGAMSPPERVADSRSGRGITGPVGPGQPVSLVLSGRPPGATVAAVQVTAIGGATGGYLSEGFLPSSTSVLNYGAHQTAGNLVLLPIDPATGAVHVYNTGGPVQLVLDLQGYYTTGGGAAFEPVAGSRVADSRARLGMSGPLVGNATAAVKVAGVAGSPVPAGAKVALVNVTVTGPTSGGYLVPGTAGGSSVLNYTNGQTVGNLVALPVDASGYVRLHQVGSGTVQLILDIQGYLE